MSQIELSGKLISTTFTGELDGDSMRCTADFAGFPGYWTSKRVSSTTKTPENAAHFGHKTGVTGTWKLEIRTGAANSYPTFTLKQEGETITRRCKASFGEAPIIGSVKVAASGIRLAPAHRSRSERRNHLRYTRLLAARKLSLEQVPVHVAENLSLAPVRADRLMDNCSHEEAEWDMELLAPELDELRSLDMDLKLTGFNP